MSGTPIPGLRAVDHFAITVPDLEEAIQFFVDVIGGAHVYTTGVFDDPDGDWMKSHINVHPRSVLRIGMVRLGEQANLELMEYSSPDQRTDHPKNTDHGASHLCLYVDDVDVAADHLRDVPGVTVLGDPTSVGANQPNEGARFIYVLSPWGYQLELISVPHGMAYERLGSAMLAQPGIWNNEKGNS